jgi:putative membrane protein
LQSAAKFKRDFTLKRTSGKMACFSLKHLHMKKNLKKTIFVLGITAFSAVAFAQNQMSTTDTNNPPGSQISAQGFVWEAAETDKKEIHLGELALQKSDNDNVKDYAKRIVADHTKASKKLQAIAEKEGLDYPSTNSIAWDTNGTWHTNSAGDSKYPATENQDKDSPPHLASLQVSNNIEGWTNGESGVSEMDWDALSGAEFDRAFVHHMIAGHQQAIRKFELAAENLQDPALKKYAKKTLPVLREHLRLAQELQSQLTAWSDSGATNSAYSNSTGSANQ